MRPTPLQWIFGSRYTLPIWIGLGLWLWFSQGGSWKNFTEDQQISFVILGAFFVLAFLKSFPTVYFWEREQSRYRKSSMSPEERWQRATVSQTLLLLLVAAAALYFGFNWWKSTPEPQPTTTKATLTLGSASVLATTAYLKVKAWRSRSEAEPPATVSWCLPVPQQTGQPVSQLPDYCRKVMTTAQNTTTAAQEPAAQPQVRAQVQA